VKVARARLILLRSAKRLGHDPHDLRAQRITDLFFQVSLFTSWDVLDIRACEAHSRADLTMELYSLLLSLVPNRTLGTRRLTDADVIGAE